MKMKKLFTKKLLIFILCLGCFAPILSTANPPVQPGSGSAAPYSDLPIEPVEN